MAEDSILQSLLKLKVRYLFTGADANPIKTASPSGSKKFLVIVTEVIVECFDTV